MNSTGDPVQVSVSTPAVLVMPGLVAGAGTLNRHAIQFLANHADEIVTHDPLDGVGLRRHLERDLDVAD